MKGQTHMEKSKTYKFSTYYLGKITKWNNGFVQEKISYY